MVISSPSISAKLFITANRYDKKTYIVDVKNGTFYDCLLDYPDTNYVFRPAYGLINNKPLVCDGNRNEKVNDCYIFHDAKWRKSVSLPEPSRFSGSTVIDSRILWIGGNLPGYNQNSVQTNMGFSMFGRTEQFGQKTEQFGRTVLPNICTYNKTKITGLLRIIFSVITFYWFFQ